MPPGPPSSPTPPNPYKRPKLLFRSKRSSIQPDAQPAQTVAPSAGAQGSDYQSPRQTESYAAPPPVPAQPVVPGQPPAGVPPTPPAPASPYDFMTASAKPAEQHFTLPGAGASLPIRALLAAGALLVLLIVFFIAKNALSGSPALMPYVAVVQDQQELLHLAGNAAQQQRGVSVASQYFAGTAQLSLASSQNALTVYLTSQGQKVTPKVLNLKVSASIDKQLQAASAATTYDQTFQQIVKTQLGAYMNDLKRAYDQTKGAHGHALLTSDYKQAQLLLKQLQGPGQ